MSLYIGESSFRNGNRKVRATMQDEMIIELYWQRDERAIEETDRQYGAYLFRIACNILADVEDSRESLSDTYLKAWNSMPPARPPSTVLPRRRSQEKSGCGVRPTRKLPAR